MSEERKMKNEYPFDLEEKKNDTEDWHLLDEFYYMAEELWPKEATEIDDRHCYLWFRKTPWMKYTDYNQRNKRVYDKCVKWYKEKHPDVEIDSDDFWIRCADDIITTAFINRNYIMADDYDDYTIKGRVKNYDVVLQTTLGGL